MSNLIEPQIKATDLPMALYLNQRLTFDLLAMLEGGFSNFATVQTTSSGTTETEFSGGAQLGLSNVFALLNMQLGGKGSRKAGHNVSESTTENIVHTPVSLFAQLRKDLHELELVRSVSDLSTLEKVRPSDFLEFEATLQRNQFLVQLSAFSELVPIMSAFEEPTASKGSRSRNQNRNANSVMLNQIKSLLSALTTGGSQDLVSKIGEIRVVITTEQQYFIDPTMNDTIDGTFRVFGKASRVIQGDGSESISLLRKAPLGQFKNLLPTIQEAMSQFTKELGYSGDSSTEIQGPAIQVIPIAIFS